jgi:hypothetical protein
MQHCRRAAADRQDIIGVDRSGCDFAAGVTVAGATSTGTLSPVSMEASTDAVPSRTRAVGGYALSRADDRGVTEANVFNRDPGFHPVTLPCRGHRPQLRQGADGRGGLAAGASVQPFAETDEGDQQRG